MAWRNPWYNDKEPEESFVDKMQIDTLKEKGFHYNEDEEEWERVWVVATRDGSERSREVYKQGEDGWKVVMYGDKGNVFFEHGVDGTE